jgi:hypothetical protein
MRVRVAVGAAIAAVVCIGSVSQASAQERTTMRPLEQAVRAAAEELVPADGPAPSTGADAEPIDTPASRPAMLAPLYTSYAMLQALDVYSTRRALNKGASEANPVMRGLSGNPAQLITVKAVATVVTIVAGERLWKKHRVGSVLLMAGVNSAMGWVVAHNYRVAR